MFHQKPSSQENLYVHLTKESQAKLFRSVYMRWLHSSKKCSYNYTFRQQKSFVQSRQT